MSSIETLVVSGEPQGTRLARFGLRRAPCEALRPARKLASVTRVLGRSSMSETIWAPPRTAAGGSRGETRLSFVRVGVSACLELLVKHGGEDVYFIVSSELRVQSCKTVVPGLYIYTYR